MAQKIKSTKKPLSGKQYDSITTSYYTLKNKVYKLVSSGKLSDTAQKELKKFMSGLEKARSNVNWYRATNYLRG